MAFILPDAWQPATLMETVRAMLAEHMPIPEKPVDHGWRRFRSDIKVEKTIAATAPIRSVIDPWLENFLSVVENDGYKAYDIASLDVNATDEGILASLCIHLQPAVRLPEIHEP